MEYWNFLRLHVLTIQIVLLLNTSLEIEKDCFQQKIIKEK